MSWIKCDYCKGLIDSDKDPDFFVEDLTGHDVDHVYCEPCREKLQDELDACQSQQSWHENQALNKADSITMDARLEIAGGEHV